MREWEISKYERMRERTLHLSTYFFLRLWGSTLDSGDLKSARSYEFSVSGRLSDAEVTMSSGRKLSCYKHNYHCRLQTLLTSLTWESSTLRLLAWEESRPRLDQEVCEEEDEVPASASRGDRSVVHLRRIVRRWWRAGGDDDRWWPDQVMTRIQLGDPEQKRTVTDWTWPRAAALYWVLTSGKWQDTNPVDPRLGQ